jgi:hypothetical protein
MAFHRFFDSIPLPACRFGKPHLCRPPFVTSRFYFI